MSLSNDKNRCCICLESDNQILRLHKDYEHFIHLECFHHIEAETGLEVVEFLCPQCTGKSDFFWEQLREFWQGTKTKHWEALAINQDYEQLVLEVINEKNNIKHILFRTFRNLIEGSGKTCFSKMVSRPSKDHNVTNIDFLFLCAIAKQDTKLFWVCIQSGASPDAYNHHALFLATHFTSLEIAEELLLRMESMDDLPANIVLAATHNNNLRFIELLAECGAKFDDVNNGEGYHLYFAVALRRRSIAEYFLLDDSINFAENLNIQERIKKDEEEEHLVPFLDELQSWFIQRITELRLDQSIINRP